MLGLECPEDDADGNPDWEVSATVDDALKLDLENYMPGDILVKTDRASMAHGLELRAPFLDADFASFCISLPSDFKVTTRTSKVILREAFGHDWPGSLRTRGKQGFGAPVRDWLQRSSVRALTQEYLNNHNSRIFGVISYAATRPYVSEMSYKTWSLLVFALWAENHLKSPAPSEGMERELGQG